MEKYYLKENGKEVNIGDIIKISLNFHNAYGYKVTVEDTVLVTKENLPSLICQGFIVKKETDTSDSSKLVCQDILDELDYYIAKVMRKLCVSNLDKLKSEYPGAFLSMIAREIAVELDKKYANHISNSPEIYVLSLLHGKITVANKAVIKNYRNFAAFRSLEDARFACKILRPMLKPMYKA